MIEATRGYDCHSSVGEALWYWIGDLENGVFGIKFYYITPWLSDY